MNLGRVFNSFYYHLLIHRHKISWQSMFVELPYQGELVALLQPNLWGWGWRHAPNSHKIERMNAQPLLGKLPIGRRFRRSPYQANCRTDYPSTTTRCGMRNHKMILSRKINTLRISYSLFILRIINSTKGYNLRIKGNNFIFPQHPQSFILIRIILMTEVILVLWPPLG